MRLVVEEPPRRNGEEKAKTRFYAIFSEISVSTQLARRTPSAG